MPSTARLQIASADTADLLALSTARTQHRKTWLSRFMEALAQSRKLTAERVIAQHAHLMPQHNQRRLQVRRMSEKAH